MAHTTLRFAFGSTKLLQLPSTLLLAPHPPLRHVAFTSGPRSVIFPVVVMEPASARALGIAHVVANILHHAQHHQHFLHDQGYSVSWLPRHALVNKLWADEVTELIWAELNTLAPLDCIKVDRRPYYAAKIRKLKIVLDPKSPSATACLSGLLLPRLNEVELMFYYDATLQHIPPVLVPQLRVVTVHCSNRCLSRATEYALEAITMRCQHLELFKYIGPSRHLDSSLLHTLLKSQQTTLSDIRIHMADSITQYCLSEDIVTYLAEQSIVRNIKAPQVRLCAPRKFGNSALFQALEVLDIKADYHSLYSISASLPKLKILQISLIRCESLSAEPLDPLLSRLAGSTELEVLKLDRRPRLRQGTLEIGTTVTLSGAGFTDFARCCRKLRKLCLEIQPGLVTEDFTASQLRQAASFLHDLREVGLFFTPEASTLTVAAVSTFGECCPKLEACHILGEFTVLDIDWETDTVYANLRRLSLNQIRGEEANSALDKYDTKLRKKFPRLELLQVMKAFPGPLSAGASYLYDVPRTPRSDPST